MYAKALGLMYVSGKNSFMPVVDMAVAVSRKM